MLAKVVVLFTLFTSGLLSPSLLLSLRFCRSALRSSSGVYRFLSVGVYFVFLVLLSIVHLVFTESMYLLLTMTMSPRFMNQSSDPLSYCPVGQCALGLNGNR